LESRYVWHNPRFYLAWLALLAASSEGFIIMKARPLKYLITLLLICLGRSGLLSFFASLPSTFTERVSV
jgi:hypothetical protein